MLHLFLQLALVSRLVIQGVGVRAGDDKDAVGRRDDG